MIALLSFLLAVLVSPLRSNSSLLAENAFLRHQVLVLRRKVKGRIPLTNGDRWFLVLFYRWFPSILGSLVVIRPETLIRWHRGGFRHYWRWKSRSRGGRPRIDAELRAVIRQMRSENPLWGAPIIHGEPLKSASTSPNPVSPNTWSGGVDHQVRAGEHSCAITRRKLQRWICLSSPPSASGCSMLS